MKRSIIFLADGFEEIEAVTIIDILKRAAIQCVTASVGGALEVNGAHDIRLITDVDISAVSTSDFDAVILPGGMKGAITLSECVPVLNFIKQMYSTNKIVAAICAAPLVLREADILSGLKVTSYPGVLSSGNEYNYSEDEVVHDGNIITGRGPGTAAAFTFEILRTLGLSDASEKLRKSMLYQH